MSLRPIKKHAGGEGFSGKVGPEGPMFVYLSLFLSVLLEAQPQSPFVSVCLCWFLSIRLSCSIRL